MISAPLELRRSTHGSEAAALFVPGTDSAAVLAVLQQLALEPAPRVYRLAGGFLLRPDAPLVAAVAGAIRLRAAGPQMFVPLDARLSPNLLDDELAGLGAGVLLPGAPLKSFEPAQPVALAELLSFGQARRPAFTPLGEPTARAQEIRELILDRPEDDAEELMRQAGQGIGEQEPSADGDSSLKGKAEFKAGRAIAGLGKALGMEGLEKLGGKLMNKGLNDSPDQLQGLLGRQEAALRELLRKFREGNIEEALKRALPVSDQPGRGSREAGTANLPIHNLQYSLGNILGGAAGGAASWYTEPDIYAALIAEYRKASELAIQEGDHRRAAFIQGKLLNDWRGAANVLQQAGLHHDAAVLFLQKLNDKPAAARAFEAAGEIDQAVRIYRGIGRHVEAGDLLRRAGDEAAALREFHAGADQLCERSDFVAAGTLIRQKSGDVAAAADYYRRGWIARGHGQVAACGVHLLVAQADLENPDGVLEMLAEAERFYLAPGQDADAANFFNMAATLARRESMGASQAEVRDRALNGVANKLRQRAARADGSAQLLARSDAWSAATISDAGFALRATLQKRKTSSGPRSAESVVTNLRLCGGPVGPCAWAAASSTLFVTTVDGGIRSFSPERGSADVDVREGLPVAIAVSEDGRYLAVQAATSGEGGAQATLSSYVRRDDGKWRLCRRIGVAPGEDWLAMSGAGGTHLLAAPLSGGYRVLGADSLAPRIVPGPPPPNFAVERPFLLRAQPKDGPASWLLLMFAARSAYFRWLEASPGQWFEAALHWQPNLPLAGGLSVLRTGADTAEVAGLNEFGSLYWSRLEFASGGFGRAESRVVAAQGDYLCCTLCGPGQIAAVGRSSVGWFIRQGENFTFKAAVKINAQQAVSCHFSDGTRELIILSADGNLQLVPAPL